MRKNRPDHWTKKKVLMVVDTEHHIVPQSRDGGKGKNVKIVPSDFHCAYHKLFANMTPSEVVFYLAEVWFTYKTFVSPEDWLKTERSVIE